MVSFILWMSLTGKWLLMTLLFSSKEETKKGCKKAVLVPSGL